MPMTQAALDALMAILIDADGPWEPGTLFLGVAPLVTDHGLATVLGDVTLAPGTLAAALEIEELTAPIQMTDGRRMVQGPALVFTAADADDNTVVAFWYIADAATAGNLLYWGPLSGELPIVFGGPNVTVVPRFTVDPNGQWNAMVTLPG